MEMTWLRVDDAFPEHERVMAIKGVGAKWLHLVALCQSSKNLTDGYIDPKRLKVICAIADVPRSAHCVQQLVDVGLWLETADGGHQIKDYLDYNPDAETVKARREQRKAAGKAGAERRWGGVNDGVGYSDSLSVGYGASGMHPDPDPDPDPQELKSHRPVGDIPGSKTQDLDAFKAAARLYELIPVADRDSGTQQIVLRAAREGVSKEDFDEIHDSLQRKLDADGLFKGAGAYVNGALRKAARKAA